MYPTWPVSNDYICILCTYAQNADRKKSCFNKNRGSRACNVSFYALQHNSCVREAGID